MRLTKGIGLPAAFRSRKRLSSRRRRSQAPGSSKSLQKALRLLLHLAESGPEMGITQLANDLDLNKTTVYRLLNAMQSFDFIEKSPANEKYRLGLRLHELGCRALDSRTLSGESHTFLVELARRCNESVSIAALAGGNIVCLDRVDSRDAIIIARTPIGGRFQPHCTAVGKAILAFLPTAQMGEVVKRNGMPCFTSSTIVSYKALRLELELTRRRGYAVDSGELENGLSGIAAPVFMRGTDVVAAVGMAGPTPRFLGEEFAKRLPLIRDFAARISRAFGRRASELPVPRQGSFYEPFS
jgi:IclR family transcriptional regulator, KDG regulon repressor